MKNYFANCITVQEAKALFRKLAQKLHPDTGGNEEAFKTMLNEFHLFRPSEERYEGESTNFQKYSGSFAEAIERLIKIKIKGIIIDVAGSWIWITGNTKEVKEEIKAAAGESYKVSFSKKKMAWYFKPADSNYRKRHSTEYSIDEIKGMWGGERINRTFNPSPRIGS